MKKLRCMSSKLLLTERSWWGRLPWLLPLPHRYFSTLTCLSPTESGPCLPISLVPTATLKAEIIFTYCICTYCIYYTHLIYIYSYIKFSYRHTFLVLFVRCWLHFQQEASKWKIRICLPRIPTKVLHHAASCHCSTRVQSVPWRCSWKGRGLLEQFKRRPDTVESAWSAGRRVPEMLWARWSNSQLKNPQGRRASASTGGSAAGDGLWAGLCQP